MRVILLLVTLALPASTVARPGPEPGPPAERGLAQQRLDCVANRVQHARPGAPIRPRTLDELPSGKLYLTVERQVDGCREFVLASEERSRLGR